MKTEYYYLYGKLPIRFRATESGGLRPESFDFNLEKFVADYDMGNEILRDLEGRAREVGKRDFDAAIENIRRSRE